MVPGTLHQGVSWETATGCSGEAFKKYHPFQCHHQKSTTQNTHDMGHMICLELERTSEQGLPTAVPPSTLSNHTSPSHTCAHTREQSGPATWRDYALVLAVHNGCHQQVLEDAQDLPGYDVATAVGAAL